MTTSTSHALVDQQDNKFVQTQNGGCRAELWRSYLPLLVLAFSTSRLISLMKLLELFHFVCEPVLQRDAKLSLPNVFLKLRCMSA